MRQCTQLKPNGRMMLFMAASEMLVEDKLRANIGQRGVEASEPFPNVFAIPCDLNLLRELTSDWSNEFDVLQQKQIACYLTVDNNVPPISELMQTHNLNKLNELVDSHWIEEFIESRKITTYFQPIVSLSNPQHVYGYECLMRGQEQDGEIVSPLRLLNAARTSGLLAELDLLSMMTAIESAHRVGLSECIFINVLPQHLVEEARFVDATIQGALSSGWDPDKVVIEVTESDQINDVAKLNDVLAQFREVGFRIALDDVGAGYNSLSTLAAVIPDFVKVDIDLIRGVSDNPYKGCVTRKLLELSRELGCKTVAEGIETIEEWTWARDQGADFGQGFLIAKPAPYPEKVNDLPVLDPFKCESSPMATTQ